VIVALVGFQVWFSLQLLSQNGRLIGRLEALEAALANLTSGAASSENGRQTPLGAGLGHAGLPVGSPAPDFTLSDLEGEPHSLDSLLSHGRPLLLVFFDAGCGPCQVLMPEIAMWQRAHVHRLTVAVVAAGEEESIRAKTQEHALRLVLVQHQREISDPYHASGTPTAVVIGVDGRIQSPVVAGADMIRTLVGRATRAALPIEHVPGYNGHRDSEMEVNGSRVGQPAPELDLEDLAGRRVALKDAFGQRTVATFGIPAAVSASRCSRTSRRSRTIRRMGCRVWW
jgi:peroxiredoxin